MSEIDDDDKTNDRNDQAMIKPARGHEMKGVMAVSSEGWRDTWRIDGTKCTNWEENAFTHKEMEGSKETEIQKRSAKSAMVVTHPSAQYF